MQNTERVMLCTKIEGFADGGWKKIKLIRNGTSILSGTYKG